MVIVTVIGILATLGYSRFNHHVAKTRQAEAKNNLNHLVSLQEVYLMEHGRYHFLRGVGLERGKKPAEWACSTDTPGKEMKNELGFRPNNCDELRYQYWSPNHSAQCVGPGSCAGKNESACTSDTTCSWTTFKCKIKGNPSPAPTPSCSSSIRNSESTCTSDGKCSWTPIFNMRADSNPAKTKVYIWPDCDIKDAWRVTAGQRKPHQQYSNRQVLKACK